MFVTLSTPVGDDDRQKSSLSYVCRNDLPLGPETCCFPVRRGPERTPPVCPVKGGQTVGVLHLFSPDLQTRGSRLVLSLQFETTYGIPGQLNLEGKTSV